MFDDYALVGSGLLYVTAFAVAMMAITVWIFKTDRLLTGRIGKGSMNGTLARIGGRGLFGKR
jgi:hypothetical protein